MEGSCQRQCLIPDAATSGTTEGLGTVNKTEPMQDNEEGSGNETGGGKITEGDPKGEDKNAWLLHAVPELPGPGVRVGLRVHTDVASASGLLC